MRRIMTTKVEQVFNMENRRQKAKYKGSRQMYKLRHSILLIKTIECVIRF